MYRDNENASLLLPPSYFAGANTRYGFRGLFDTLFSRAQADALYILQGGPGTGKSRFMQEVFQAARPLCTQAELYYCSSDPDSLDGILLDMPGGRVGILDGTAPHGRLMSAPGYFENIINLGDFWDSARLQAFGREIAAADTEKKEAWQRGYAALSAAGIHMAERHRQLLRIFRKEKAERFFCRMLKSINPQKGPQSEKYIDALGMTGRVHLRTAEQFYPECYQLHDVLGASALCLEILWQQACREGVLAVRLPDPVDPALSAGICFPGTGVCILKECAEPIKVINSGRFLSPEGLKADRASLRRLTHDSADAIHRALECFADAGIYHFALENIYSATMDFSAKEEKTQIFIRTLLAGRM